MAVDHITGEQTCDRIREILRERAYEPAYLEFGQGHHNTERIIGAYHGDGCTIVYNRQGDTLELTVVNGDETHARNILDGLRAECYK